MDLNGQPMSGKLSVADPGEDPTPLIFRPNEGPKGRNNFFDGSRTSEITDDDWEPGLKFKLVHKFPSGEQRDNI